MIIVVSSHWKKKRKSCVFTLRDTWSAHETLEEATACYNELRLQKDLYSASICGVINSTDYQPYEENE